MVRKIIESSFSWDNWITNLITIIGLLGTLLGLILAWVQAHKAKGYSEGVKEMKTQIETLKNESEKAIQEIQKKAETQINEEKIEAIKKIKGIINFKTEISSLASLNTMLEDIHAKLIVIDTSKPLSRNDKTLKPIINTLRKCNTKNIPNDISKVIENFILGQSLDVSKNELEKFLYDLEHVLQDIDKKLNGEI